MLLGTASAAMTGGMQMHAAAFSSGRGNARENQSSFMEILRQPDSVVAFVGLNQPMPLERHASEWTASDVHIEPVVQNFGLQLFLSAPIARLTHVRLRWQVAVPEPIKILGDHWERSYGDLSWRAIVPERVLPWYFLTSGRSGVHGYGVKTGAGALCFWQVDPEGVCLWLNVANGGDGVVLGSRRLLMATVVTRKGTSDETPLHAAQQFCSRMCGHARLPEACVYGSNDWYYAYGRNSAGQTLRDADLMAACAPPQGPRPFTIIDDGWKRKEAFADMQALASEIRSRKVRPGIWVRPLQAGADTPAPSVLPAARYGAHTSRYGEIAYDPTTSDGLEAALSKIRQAVEWGYELVKHDFSTYELLGRWGSEMGGEPTASGWHFQDRSKTTAEIILDFYKAIRSAAGEKVILLGCNTIGHLSAGLFEIQRTGDDVSGRVWERTRRMGVNTLAGRLAQNRTFFLQDADCVPITSEIDWKKTQQWLDLVARSGTALLISPQPAAIQQEQKDAIKEAFAIAAAQTNQAKITDWLENTTPRQWQFAGTEKEYDWCGESGAWPYEI